MAYVIPASSNPDFESELTRRYGQSARSGACEVLEGLKLPVPHTRDYLLGKESLHVFLRTQALVLRFGQPSLSKISDSVLQPLKIISLNERADFEINPGIRVGGSLLDKIRLKAALFRQGEHFPRIEMIRSNIGGISLFNPRKLVLDRCAVVPLSMSFNYGSHASQPIDVETGAPVQAAHFEIFRKLSEATFARSGTNIDARARDALFDLCKAHAAMPDADPSKKLFNHWVMPGIQRPRHRIINAASDEYAMRCG